MIKTLLTFSWMSKMWCLPKTPKPTIITILIKLLKPTNPRTELALKSSPTPQLDNKAVQLSSLSNHLILGNYMQNLSKYPSFTLSAKL